jgi:FkbM family methyltransferase
MTFEDFKTRSRRLIARNRGHASVRALHRLATFIDGCYENDEWDMCANGETTLIERLAPARFRTVFDVGAHVGDWSIEALGAWPDARVHAFEVAPPTFERLKRRIDEAGLSARSTLVCKGLGDVTATRNMYYFPDHPNLTCDLPRHEYESRPFCAEMIDGDGYVRQQGLERIDFLKIDVEGAEHLVLKGLAETLDAGNVDCIQFEYGAFSIQTRVLLADYYERLAPRYSIGKIYPRSVEFRDYHWTMESFRFSNFLCVSRGRPDLKALAEGAPQVAAASGTGR